MSGGPEATKVKLWTPQPGLVIPDANGVAKLNGAASAIPMGADLGITPTGISVVSFPGSNDIVSSADRNGSLLSAERKLRQPTHRLVWLDDFSGAAQTQRPGDGRSTNDCLNAVERVCRENGVQYLPPLRVNSNVYALRPESADYLSDQAYRKAVQTHGEDVKFVEVVVCDPGVGGAREAMVAETENGQILVGPNNGVYSRIIAREGIKVGADGQPRLYKVKDEKFLEVETPTFHGEAVFAILAGEIMAGKDPAKLTEWLEPMDREKLILLPRKKNQVLDVDHLNLIRVDAEMPDDTPTHAKVTVIERGTGRQRAWIIPSGEKFVDGETGQLLVFKASDIDPVTKRNYIDIAACNAVHGYEPHALKQLSVDYEHSPIEPGDVLGIEWLHGDYGKGGEVLPKRRSVLV